MSIVGGYVLRIPTVIFCGAVLTSCSHVATPSALPAALANDTSTAHSLTGNGYAVLYSFKGAPHDGAYPYFGLAASDGALYGSTTNGGDDHYCQYGCGTVFSLSASGIETVLFRFDGKDGNWPESGVTPLDGALYGTDVGSVFKVSTSGKEHRLYNFKGSPDGSTPHALTSLYGILYGPTQFGGNNGCGHTSTQGCGTIFQLGASGAEKVLYAFKGGSDGSWPIGSLLYTSGAFYGTTNGGGGSTNCKWGCGTVFALTTGGSERIVYSFNGGSDGAYPVAGLIALHGVLYGTTSFGGSGCGSTGCGTVFAVSASGSERIIYRFKGGTDGSLPWYGSLVSIKGKLYGTTQYGGANGDGTIFEVSASGKERVLYSFKGAPDGANPFGGLTDMKGMLYGTTANGGSNGYGTIFQIKP